MKYSQAFKATMVKKMATAPTKSATEVAQETGVSQPTLSRWLREAGSIAGMSKKKRPQDRSAEEKLDMVLEAASLLEEELGAFLRRSGLREVDLDRWRTQMLQGLSAAKKCAPHEKQVRELQRDLRVKEKALAEASALLVLKKKAHEIWGGVDDDTARRSGR